MATLEVADLESSYYLDDKLYDRLAAMPGEAAALGPSTDPKAVFEAQCFLHHEARLLDHRDFDAWFMLFVEQPIYWVPTHEDKDPRKFASLWLDDRRRLLDRIARFKTGYVHNQVPYRRLRRQLGNVEAWDCSNGERRVLSNQIIHEFRSGKPMVQHVAHVDHLLRREDGAWKIAIKRAVLINGEANFDVPTLL